MSKKLWTAERECSTALAIRTAERSAWETLGSLGLNLKREGAPRIRVVDGLSAAVLTAQFLAQSRPELGSAAALAACSWRQAEALTWALAMSGQRIALAEAHKRASSILSEEDLAQEGYVGLLMAARRFDPERQLRFGTYARWWVRAQMHRALDSAAHLVRLPGGIVELCRTLRRLEEDLAQRGAPADLDLLAERLGVQPARAAELQALGAGVLVPLPDDSVAGVPGERGLADEGQVRQDEWVGHQQLMARMRDSLRSGLKQTEQQVLIARFGLDGAEPQKRALIGSELNLSREHVRLTELAALKRLRRLISPQARHPTADSTPAVG